MHPTETVTGKPFALPIRMVAPLVVAALGIAALGAAWLLLRHPRSDDPTRVAALRARTPTGMALVPAGDFWMGSDDPEDDEDVRPRRRAALPSFYIDLHEVTNREFQKFDPSHQFPTGDEDVAAGNITYDAASAYARWAGKRLPTEAEWEKAARGTDGRRYPWGDTWEAARVAPRRKRVGETAAPAPIVSKAKLCSIGPSRLEPVGSRPAGASPYGCVDMAGNAWEWVQGFYNGNREQRILRGGAVGYGERACRTYVRSVEGAADT